MSNLVGIGIDVSKAFLDVVIYGQKRSRRFTNQVAGFVLLFAWLKVELGDACTSIARALVQGYRRL